MFLKIFFILLSLTGYLTAIEVFLGGSCNPTTWRKDIAIPTLKKLKITYYNPQVEEWKPELIAEEFNAKEGASVLLFVIDKQTRNTASMVEVAQLAATRCQSLVLAVYQYDKGQTIAGEKISLQEYRDLINGVQILQHLTKRQGTPIFDNLSAALGSIPQILRDQKSGRHSNSVDATCKSGNYSPAPGYKVRRLYVGAVNKHRDVLDSIASSLKKSESMNILYPPITNDYTLKQLTTRNELQRIMDSRVVLLIIPNNSRGIGISTLAAYLIGLHANLVLCIEPMPNEITILGEQLTSLAKKDYSRGRNYLSDYAKRQKVPVFDNTADALKYAINQI